VHIPRICPAAANRRDRRRVRCLGRRRLVVGYRGGSPAGGGTDEHEASRDDDVVCHGGRRGRDIPCRTIVRGGARPRPGAPAATIAATSASVSRLTAAARKTRPPGQGAALFALTAENFHPPLSCTINTREAADGPVAAASQNDHDGRFSYPAVTVP
jgi:hypothetical protein